MGQPIIVGWALLLGSLHALSCRANQRPTRGLVDPITKTTSPYFSNYIKSVKLPFFLARFNRLPPKSPTFFLLSIYSIVDHTRIDQDRQRIALSRGPASTVFFGMEGAPATSSSIGLLLCLESANYQHSHHMEETRLNRNKGRA